MFSAECGMISAARAPGQGSPLGSGRDEASTGAAVRSMFAAVAPRYDFLNHFLSLGRDIAWRRATRSRAEGNSGAPRFAGCRPLLWNGRFEFLPRPPFPRGGDGSGLLPSHAGDRAGQSRARKPGASTSWKPTRCTCLLAMLRWMRSRPLSDFATWPIMAGELKKCGGS